MIGGDRLVFLNGQLSKGDGNDRHTIGSIVQSMEKLMKTWNKPQVREQEVGLEVTSYLPAEIDVI